MNRKTSLLLVISILFIPFCLFPFYSTAQTGDAESPSLITDLAGNELVWRIDNATGVFAGVEYQTGDLVKYQVLSADLPTQKYIVSFSKKSWGDTEYEELNVSHVAGGLLVARNWQDVGTDNVASVATYWGTETIIDRKFVSTYRTEWWNLNLINTASIRYEMNESNYDESVYSRAEGILLTRTAVVNANNGEFRGYLKITLVSYSGFFALSPWYWLVMVMIVFAFFAIIIILIASVVRKRELVMEDPEEISVGGIIIGAFFIFWGLYGYFQSVVNPVILYPGLEADFSIPYTTLVFSVMGLIIVLLMAMNKERVVRNGSAMGAGLIVIGAVLVILWNLLRPTNLYEAYDFLDLGVGSYILGCMYMIFGSILVLLLNLKEERDVGAAIAVFIIMLGIAIYFLIDLGLYISTLTTVFDIDILRIFVSLVLMQMGLFLILLGPFVIFLPLLRKR